MRRARESRAGTVRWLHIGAVVALALVLRLYHLGEKNFWIDEISTIQVAAQSPADIIRNYRPAADVSHRDQAPLSFLIIHYFISPQHPEWTARLPSAFFSLGGVIALYCAGRLLFPARTALLGAALLASAPLDVWYAQEVRWYAQWTLWTTLSYLALVAAWKRGGISVWAAYVVCCALAIYTFVFSFLVMACQAVTAYLLDRSGGQRRRFVARALAAQVVAVVSATPVLWLIFHHLLTPTGTARPKTLAVLGYTLFTYAVGFSLGPTIGYLHTAVSPVQVVSAYPSVALVTAVFLPLLVLGLRRLRHDERGFAVVGPWAVGFPLLVLALTLCTNVVYQVRYTLAALPAFWLVVACGVESVPRGLRRALAGAALVACCYWSLGNYYWNPAYGKEDVKSALAATTRLDGDGSPILAVGQVSDAVRYYADGRLVVRLDSCDVTPEGRDPLQAPRLRDHGGLWLIAGRDWDGQATRCLQRLASSHIALQRQHFGGVDLWMLARRPADPQSAYCESTRTSASDR